MDEGRKKENKLMLPLLVWNYLCKFSDINHLITADTIIDYLKENGIYAERRTIYRNIEQLNVILYMIDNECTLKEATEELSADPDAGSIKHLHKRGYYIEHQNYDFDDLRLLIESVYSARFIDSANLNRLVGVISSLTTEENAELLEHSVLNIDHRRTKNKKTFDYVTEINKAMSQKLDGKPHEPEKISFIQTTHTIDNVKETVKKNKGKKIVVSPYKIIINDGNYYLRCFADEPQAMRNYRIDRMSDVERLGIPRDGYEVARAEDYSSFLLTHFGMFDGTRQMVRIRCNNHLLDTIIDRFGDEKLKYSKYDNHNFVVTAEVDISKQFYGWLCGLGDSVEILDPEGVKQGYIEHLKHIMKKYE